MKGDAYLQQGRDVATFQYPASHTFTSFCPGRRCERCFTHFSLVDGRHGVAALPPATRRMVCRRWNCTFSPQSGELSGHDGLLNVRN